jgi:DNA-3-methyladenine glycosylase
MVSEQTMRVILAQSADVAARSMLGWELVRVMPEGEVATCRIVETEAYHESEPGCHAHKGKTERNQAMFSRAGHAYIYFIYGMYHCLNVSCGKEGEGAAVLIRAAEPISPQALRLSGPGLLCRALLIDRELYGCDMLSTSSPLQLRKRSLRSGEEVAVTKRIGLSEEQSPGLLWRYFIKDNPSVSRQPKKR